MNNNLWNISLPIKLFDKDITTNDLIDFIFYDEVSQERLRNNTLFIINSQSNDYIMWNMDAVAGKVNVLYMEGNDLFANVDILLSTPTGKLTKGMYETLHVNNKPVFYLTPHGIKRDGKIMDINAFTMWYCPPHGSPLHMDLMTK